MTGKKETKLYSIFVSKTLHLIIVIKSLCANLVTNALYKLCSLHGHSVIYYRGCSSRWPCEGQDSLLGPEYPSLDMKM